MIISEQELQIFSRHLILKEFKDKLFNKFRKQNITIVGMGGIGCPTAQYLISTGIKKIKIIDGDIIQKTNLNRQTLYTIDDIGESKVKIAKKSLLYINPESKIQTKNYFLNKRNINKYLKNSNLIIDATDNWQTMLEINKYCVKNNLPLISSSAISFDSQVTLFYNMPKKHLCLQCVFPNKKDIDIPRCETIGILGTAAGIAGIVTAQKTINFFLNKEMKNVMTMINMKSLEINNIKIKKNIYCPILNKK